MRKFIKWLVIGAILILLLAGVYALFTYQFLDFFVDYWWFSALNYKVYFLQRLFYRYITFLAVFAVFFLLFFLNFWVASRYLGVGQRLGEKVVEKKRRYLELMKAFQSGSMKVYTPLSLLLAFPIAVPFYEQWEKGLLFFFGGRAGSEDPIFGQDIGFYLFSLPIYQLLQNKLLFVFTCLFIGICLLYWIERQLLPKGERRVAPGAKIHLSLLFILMVGIQVWGFFLERYQLVYTDAHKPLFYGPGFAEMWVDVPRIWISLALFIITAIFMLRYFHTRKGIKPLIVLVGLVALIMWPKTTLWLKKSVNEYFVKPNEAIRERPYIAANIQGSLAAYGLGDVEMLNYELDKTRNVITDKNVEEAIRNIPVWDRTLLDDVYKQLQGIRPYYEFPTVDTDRYTVGGLYQQVYLAARELDLGNLPDYARNWMNKHFQYTHGYGLVMTPAAQGGDENMTWFMRDIPSRSEYGLPIPPSGIYYGLGNYNYVIVPNALGEIDHPKDGKNIITNYSGKGGIDISSEWRKLLFSIYFKEQNILLTRKTSPDSQILLHRNVTERVRKLAPFLRLDQDPYLVSLEKGLYWILDGYLVSDRYPTAPPFDGSLNYIRNSVKIVVNAYDGAVDFYYMDNINDPIAEAYKRIYPGLFKSITEMPKELKPHLRYPMDLFEVQMNIYAKYHQQDPDTFFRQEDIWELSRMRRSETSMRPYYITINLFDPEKHEFLLLSAMSPRGRNNLRALAVGGCDGENYGKIRIYSFSKGEQVYGPSQIDSLIDQDTVVAQQLTLWDQAGSQVIRGRMIILPVSNMILYIQPVYLSSATQLKIPELKRIIVSQGQIVAMAPSLEEAFQELENKLRALEERQKKRYRKEPAEPQKMTPTPPASPDENTSESKTPGLESEREHKKEEAPAPDPHKEPLKPEDKSTSLPEDTVEI